MIRTAARSVSDAKGRLVRDLVAVLRSKGISAQRSCWKDFQRNESLWDEIRDYGLGSKHRQSWLSRIAFPGARHDEVDAALDAGNNINRLYDIARGKAKIATDAAGNWIRGKKGYRIVPIA